MFLGFLERDLDIFYGFGQCRSMFLIVVFLIKKKLVYTFLQCHDDAFHRGIGVV